MTRHRSVAQHVSHDRWLVSYADFITLLFAFFVVLYASAEMDKKKVVELSAAIHGAFQQMGVFSKTSPANLKELGDAGYAPATQTATAQTTESNAGGPAEAYALQRELESLLGSEIRHREVKMRVTPEGLVLSLREVGFFDSGQARLTANALPKLARIAQVLNSHGFDIRVEGHTDDVPIHTAAFQSNWELSTARATEVVTILVETYHLDPLRISASGYGPYRPVASNATAQGRGINRRVDLVIVSRRDPPAASPKPGSADPGEEDEIK